MNMWIWGCPVAPCGQPRILARTPLVDIGDYYSWGEVETKDSYTKNTYKWGVCDTEEHVLKYNDTDKKNAPRPRGRCGKGEVGWTLAYAH